MPDSISNDLPPAIEALFDQGKLRVSEDFEIRLRARIRQQSAEEIVEMELDRLLESQPLRADSGFETRFAFRLAAERQRRNKALKRVRWLVSAGSIAAVIAIVGLLNLSRQEPVGPAQSLTMEHSAPAPARIPATAEASAATAPAIDPDVTRLMALASGLHTATPVAFSEGPVDSLSLFAD